MLNEFQHRGLKVRVILTFTLIRLLGCLYCFQVPVVSTISAILSFYNIVKLKCTHSAFLFSAIIRPASQVEQYLPKTVVMVPNRMHCHSTW